MKQLSVKQVTTRKPHKCFGCTREMPKGSKMTVIACVDNKIESVYWCEVCNTYWGKYCENGDEIGWGELKNNDLKTWKKLQKEIEIEAQK